MVEIISLDTFMLLWIWVVVLFFVLYITFVITDNTSVFVCMCISLTLSVLPILVFTVIFLIDVPLYITFGKCMMICQPDFP